jgi:hypothetical protein
MKGLHGRRQLILRFDLADAAAVESAEMTAGLSLRASAAALSFMEPLKRSTRRAIPLNAADAPDQEICKFTQEDGLGRIYM